MCIIHKEMNLWNYKGSSAIITPLWRDAGVVERGGLENRCGLYGPPWVRIPLSPLKIFDL